MAENKKICVGLSGGVDSAVSAALLKEAGHEVMGVFIRAWQAPFLSCTSEDDRESAMRAAAHLGIPFLTKDFGEAYKALVVDYLVREYARGRTPNPDVMCNKMIKFGLFFDFALRELGADAIATGHYARVRPAVAAPVDAGAATAGRCELLAGIDPAKDQSYFLWTLAQEHLAHTYFPVGGMEKREVRALAERFGLPNASRKDSQGICFLGKVSMREFLKHFIPEKQGDVLDTDGRVIGRHQGAAFITIGQRGGFTVFHESPHEPPRFIVAKDAARNTITVAPRPLEAAAAEVSAPVRIALEDEHWISGAPPHESATISVRTRYHGPLTHARLVRKSGTSVLVCMDIPEPFAAGQSAVCYDGEVCLGGGILVAGY